MKTETRFFVKASASWKDSTRRKGGYFSYSDQEIKNALIRLDGNTATIYAGAHSYGLIIYSKRTTGKYFSMTGKEVTEKTFQKHFKTLQKMAESLKADRETKEKNEKLLAMYQVKEATEKIKSLLTPEKVADWSAIGANEGNSHTRRTRWGNRAERLIGDRGWGGLLRDIVCELAKVNGEFWIDGKYNPAHL